MLWIIFWKNVKESVVLCRHSPEAHCPCHPTSWVMTAHGKAAVLWFSSEDFDQQFNPNILHSEMSLGNIFNPTLPPKAYPSMCVWILDSAHSAVLQEHFSGCLCHQHMNVREWNRCCKAHWGVNSIYHQNTLLECLLLAPFNHNISQSLVWKLETLREV